MDSALASLPFKSQIRLTIIMYQAHRVLVKVTDDLRPKLRTHGQRDLGATRATPPQLRRVDVIVEEQAWNIASTLQ